MIDEYLHEIVVTPTDTTTGADLIRVLEILHVRTRTQSLFVIDVDCNINRDWVGRGAFETTVDEIMTYARSVGQFDWLSLFFFEQAVENPAKYVNYDTLFADATLVVRAIDDTYFLVYSPDPKDVDSLSACFPIESRKVRRADVVHPT